MERQLGLRRKPLASAIPAQVLDRHDLGNIRHRTGLVTMLLPGNHQEEIRFYISWRRHTLVLGYPWLHHLNPHLNWETGEILDWGPDYHRSCLSPVVASWGTTAPAATPPDLKGVPEQYHNLIEVFSKAWTIVLPPHWPYDCAIDLPPIAASTQGHGGVHYQLSGGQADLASSSPSGAGFFFVEKKNKSLHLCIDYRGS